MGDDRALIFNIVRGSFVDGHGIRTTVFLKGCPLRCIWCCNVEGQLLPNELKVTPDKCVGCGKCIPVCPVGAISVGDAPDADAHTLAVDRKKCTMCGACTRVCYTDALALFGQSYSVEELFELAMKDEYHYRSSGGGVTIGGGEATFQPEFTYAFMKKLQENYVHVAIDTCGYTTTALGFECLKKADLLLFDLKHMDSAAHKKLTGVPNERILDNLKALNDLGKDIIVRIPLIPGLNDSEKNLRESAEFLSELRSVERVDLIGYHNYSQKKYLQLDREYLLSMPGTGEEYTQGVKEFFEAYPLHVQIGG
jgi:pyruvate formate lyase activating enzyme